MTILLTGNFQLNIFREEINHRKKKLVWQDVRLSLLIQQIMSKPCKHKIHIMFEKNCYYEKDIYIAVDVVDACLATSFNLFKKVFVPSCVFVLFFYYYYEFAL